MRRAVLIILLVFTVGRSGICLLLRNWPSIAIDEDRSLFSDYYVEENIVKIKCYVTIKNTFHHTVKYEFGLNVLRNFGVIP